MKQKTIDKVNIAMIKPGDTVLHNAEEKTVTPKDLGKDELLGRTLFGDSYHAGHKSVLLVSYRKI